MIDLNLKVVVFIFAMITSYLRHRTRDELTRGVISDFHFNHFKRSNKDPSKFDVSVFASIPTSKIRQNNYNFVELRRVNRPISVFRPLRNPSLPKET